MTDSYFDKPPDHRPPISDSSVRCLCATILEVLTLVVGMMLFERHHVECMNVPGMVALVVGLLIFLLTVYWCAKHA